MSRLLITGTRAPASFDLARKLSRAGHEVHTADSTAGRICRTSSCVAGSHRLPSPRKEREAYLAAISNLVRRHRIELIIPTCEEIFLLSARREQLGAPVFAEDLGTLRALHHKTSFQGLVRDASLPAPETYDGDDFLLRDSEGGPWITKPSFSRFGGHIIHHPDTASVRRFLESRTPGDWTVQALVEGAPRCSYSICHQGRLLAHTVYRPLAALRDGPSTVFESVHEPAIREWCECFVARHRFSGQIAFDFIVSGGVPLAIECNPRSTSGIHFFGPEIGPAFLDASPVPDPSAGLRRALFVPALLGSPLLALRTRDVIFDRADPLPFLTQAFPFGLHLLTALRNRCSLTEATIRDLRWDGEAL